MQLPRRRVAIVVAAGLCVGVAGTATASKGPYRLPAVVTTALPNSDSHTEPSMVVDSAGRIFVSAIFGFPGYIGGNPATGGIQPGTPIWRSVDDGRHWTEHSTASVGPYATNLGGGDSALVLDKRDYIYATDLWLGDDSISYSTDHANTFLGSPISHRPLDDRNWLAYSPTADAIYQIYDGYDGLWVSRADLNGPIGVNESLTFPNNYEVAPESAATNVPSKLPTYARAGIGPPGGIAVDPRNGTVYATWPDQFGVAVAKSTDKGMTWAINHIPQTTVSGANGDCLWNFVPAAVDSQGHLFVAFSRIDGGSPSAPKGISIWLAESSDGVHWTSTRLPSEATTSFPALTVIGPDRVGVGWVETTVKGNPNDTTFGSALWRLRYAEVAGLARGTKHVAETTIDSYAHAGTLFVGPQGGDRSMGDFFSMASNRRGEVYFAYTQTRRGAAVVVLARIPQHAAP